MGDNHTHAILAPSSAERWMQCPGSVLMEQGLPDVESEYAAEGTAAHEYAAKWLTTGLPPLFPWKASNGLEFSNDISESGDFGDHTKTYVWEIQKLSEGHTLLVEQKLPIGHITLEPDATGTGDAIIIHNDGQTIEINDLKFGMRVKVYAKNNKQLMMYASAARYKFAALGNFKKFILRIHQVRLNHFDEWECSLAELEEFEDFVRFRANFIWRLLKGEVEFKPNEDLWPSEEACRFCKAKATCPALAEHTLKVVAEDSVDISKNPVAKLNPAIQKLHHATNKQLSWFMQNLGLIEDWVKAVRAKTEGELLAGHDVPGFKIVAGKKGNRKWEDEKLAEAEMKAWRLKHSEMYKSELISPAVAEKFFKSNPKRWAKLSALVIQNEGKPSVAPSTDPRPQLQIGAVEDDFEVIE